MASNMGRWYGLIAIIIFGVVVHALQPILMPFLVSALLAYMANPIVDKLTRYQLSRTFSVVLIFVALTLIMSLLVFLLVPLLQNQINVLLLRIPEFIGWLETTIVPWLEEHLGGQDINLEIIRQLFAQHWQAAGHVAGSVLSRITTSTYTIVLLLTNLLLIPVVTFYLLRDWHQLLRGIRGLLPRPMEAKVVELANEGNEVLGAFFRGQLLVMLGLGLIYSLGLYVVGLDVALAIGILAGLMSIVPYLGFIVGILAASIAAIMQFGDVWSLIYVALVFGVGQVAESAFLTPLLVGDRIGLHPVAVIFAVMAGGQLFGFVGVLLALPAAAVIMVLLRHAHEYYLSSGLYDT